MQKIFKPEYFEKVGEHRGISIYKYTNMLEEINYTYWFGANECDYASGIPSFEKARGLINVEFRCGIIKEIEEGK